MACDKLFAKLSKGYWHSAVLEASHKLATSPIASEYQVLAVFDEVFFGEFVFGCFYHGVIMPHAKRFGKIFLQEYFALH